MTSLIKDKFIKIGIFLLFYVIVEIITFEWVDFIFLPEHFLIDIVIAFTLASMIFLIKSKLASILYLSFLFAIALILYMVNVTIYDVYYDLFTLQQLQLMGEAADVINLEHISLLSIVLLIVIITLYVFAMRFVYKHTALSKISSSRYYLDALPLFSFCALLIFGFFMIDSQSINNYTEHENVTAFKRSTMEDYGLFAYYTKELESIIDNDDDGGNAGVITYAPKTDYFGLFEDKNVITILLESVQPFAINEFLTPNMYRMTQEGLYFENSYSENKTNVSELIGIVGNYPMLPVNFEKQRYAFDYGLPSVLRTDGYQTAYFHSNLSSFYDRAWLMPNVGFDQLYMHDELFPEQEIWRWNGDYTLDSETMARMLDNFSDTEEPFYSYWATMVSHGPYDYGPDNKLIFEELGYFSAIDQAEQAGLWTNLFTGGDEKDIARIRHYQAAVMDLDVAIGMMLDDLEAKGILDDTIIVMYGDHNVYYHEIYLKRFAENNAYYNMDMYKNFFCIYNQDLTTAYLNLSHDEDTTISKFVTPYNIVPTLLDLLGYRYDEYMFLGHSVFADTEDVFYSMKLTGFFNQYLYSDDGEEIIYANIDYSDAEANQFFQACEELRTKISYINQVYLDSEEDRHE